MRETLIRTHGGMLTLKLLRSMPLFTCLFVLQTTTVVLALATPSWIPSSWWQHLRTCLILWVILETAILLSFIGCLLNCNAVEESEQEKRKCHQWCEYWHSVFAGVAFTIFVLCLSLGFVF